MVILGIILLLVAALLIVAAVAGASDQTVNFELGIINVVMNSLGVFFTGAATVLLIALGLWFIMGGSKRAVRRRKERKELTRRAETTAAPEPATARGPEETRTAPESSSQGSSTTSTTGTGTTGTASTDDDTLGDRRNP